jgi:hypothetical protein
MNGGARTPFYRGIDALVALNGDVRGEGQLDRHMGEFFSQKWEIFYSGGIILSKNGEKYQFNLRNKSVFTPISSEKPYMGVISSLGSTEV